MPNSVHVSIDGDARGLEAAIDKAIAELRKLDGKSVDVNLKVDTKGATEKIEALEAKIKALGDHTVHIKVDTRTARDKITYLHTRLQALGDKVIKIDVDTEKARDKIRYLHNRMTDLGNKKVQIDVDTEKARDKIRYLFNRMNELEDKKSKVDVDTANARTKITELKAQVDELKDGHANIDVDTAGALAKIAEVQAALNSLSDRTINIDINDKASDKIDRAFKNASRKSQGARNNDALSDTNAALREIEKRQRGNERIKMGLDPDWDGFDDEMSKRQSKSVIKFDVDTTVVDEKLGKIFKRGSEILKVDVVTDESGDSSIKDMRNLSAELDRIKDHKIKFEIETVYDDDGDILNRFLRTGRQRESIDLDFDLNDTDGLLAKAYALQERSAHFDLDVDDDTREFIRRLDEKSTKRIDFELEARDINGQLQHILREDSKVIKIIADDDAMNRTLKDLGKDKVVRYRVERIDNDGEIEDWLHVGDRSIRVDLDVDDAAALARIASATRDRTVKTRMVVDRDNRGLGGALSLLGITDNDIDRDVNRTGRISRSVGAMTRVIGAVPSAATKMATSITSGLAAITTRIPVLGGIFKISSGITEQFTKMGSSGAALGKIAGPIGAIGTAGIAAAAGLGILGTIGVIGTGALTGGMYVLQAAMGAVVGVTSLLGAAVGGALAGGFIYFASKAPEVGKAFDELGSHVGKAMEEISSVVVPSLVRSANKMKGAFDIMRPSLERMSEGTGKLVDQMSDKLPALASKLGPALEQAFATGAKHLNVIGDALPGIVEGMGNFFDKIGSPAVMEASKRVWNALPGMIEGTGDAINYVADKYNDISKFLKSDDIKALKDGWHDFSEELGDTDWSSVKTGVKDAMNSFGEFMGQVDGENIAQTVSGITGAFTQLTNLASNINLDGMIAGFAMGLEGLAEVVNTMVTTVKMPFVVSANIIEGAGNLWGDFQDWLGVTPKPKMDMTLDVNVIPNLSNNNNIDAELPKKIQEIVDSAPDGSRQSTKLEIPMEVLPKLMENGGLAMAEVTTILRDMKLPPTKISVPVEAAPELKEAGVIDAAEFKRLAAMPAGTMIEYDVPVAALPKLLETGAIDAGQFSRLLAGIPPAQVDVALKALPKLVEAGVISADQMSEILYQTGVYELPIDVMAIPRMLARREVTTSEIIAQIGDLPPVQKEVVVDALIKLRDSGQINIEDFNAIMSGLEVEIPANVVPQMGNLEQQLRRIQVSMDVEGKIDGNRITEQLGDLQAIITANPQLGETGTLLGALDSLEATVKANMEMENADGILRTIAAMRLSIPADIVPKPLGSESNIPPLQIPGMIAPLAAPVPPKMPPIPAELVPYYDNLMNVLNTLSPKVNVNLSASSGDLQAYLNALTTDIKVNPQLGNIDGLLSTLQGLKADIEVTPNMPGRDQLLATLDNLIVTIQTILAAPSNSIPPQPPITIPTRIGDLEIAPWMRSALEGMPKLKVPVEGDWDGIMGGAPKTLPPIDQPITMKRDPAQLQMKLPPVTQDVIVRRKEESPSGNLIMRDQIETKTVRIIPDTSALQAIVVPPITTQLHIQSNAAEIQGLMALIPLSIVTQHSVQSNAGAVAGQIQQIPLSMNTQHTVNSNVADIDARVRSIPPTMLTEHTTNTNTQSVIDMVNSIPKSSQTDHTVNTNVDSALGRIRSLSGQNTSSTHTVNVVVSGGGGLPGGASISAFSGMAGMASPMGMMSAAANTGSNLFGAAGAGGMSSNFKFSSGTDKSVLKVATIVEGGIKKAWKSAGNSAGKSFSESLIASLDAITKVVTEIVNITKSIEEINKLMNPEAEGIAEATDSVEKNTTEYQSAMQRFNNVATANPLPELQSIWAGVGTTIQTAFTSGMGSVQNIVGNSLSQIQAIVSQPITAPAINLQAIMSGDFSSVGMAIEQKKMEIQQALNGIGQVATSTTASLQSSWGIAGTTVGQAFKTGMDQSNLLVQQAMAGTKAQIEAPAVLAPAITTDVTQTVADINAKKPEIDAAVQGLTADATVAMPATESQHKINTNLIEVTSQIQSLNAMNTSSIHTITVVTLGGAAPIGGGISALSGMAGMAGGAMGIAGGGLSGAMGASGMSSNFNYTNGSGGSLLQISNLVKNGIVEAWEGLGTSVGQSFAKGIHNSQVLVVDEIGEIVGLAGKDIIVKQVVDVQGEVIGSIVEVGKTVSALDGVANSVLDLGGVLGAVGNLAGAIGGFGGALEILGPIGQVIGSLGELFTLIMPWFNQHKGGAYVSSGSLNESGQMVHYNTQQTVNNHFDGGLLGDPERQAKKVLDVLELAGSSRRSNAVLGNGGLTA